MEFRAHYTVAGTGWGNVTVSTQDGRIARKWKHQVRFLTDLRQRPKWTEIITGDMPEGEPIQTDQEPIDAEIGGDPNARELDDLPYWMYWKHGLQEAVKRRVDELEDARLMALEKDRVASLKKKASSRVTFAKWLKAKEFLEGEKKPEKAAFDKECLRASDRLSSCKLATSNFDLWRVYTNGLDYMEQARLHDRCGDMITVVDGEYYEPGPLPPSSTPAFKVRLGQERLFLRALAGHV